MTDEYINEDEDEGIEQGKTAGMDKQKIALTVGLNFYHIHNVGTVYDFHLGGVSHVDFRKVWLDIGIGILGALKSF